MQLVHLLGLILSTRVYHTSYKLSINGLHNYE